MAKIISENDNIDRVYDNIAMDYDLPKKTIQRIKSKFKELGINSTPIPMQGFEDSEMFLPSFANLMMCEDIEQDEKMQYTDTELDGKE